MLLCLDRSICCQHGNFPGHSFLHKVHFQTGSVFFWIKDSKQFGPHKKFDAHQILSQ